MTKAVLRLALVAISLSSQVSGMDFAWVTTPATSSTRTGYFIQMSGEITSGDYGRFQLFVQKNLARYKLNRFIQLESNGGDVIEALKMARLLRSMYPNITVQNGRCASSCFYLYLSGVTRHAAPSSLGIHRAYFDPKYFAGLKLEEARRKQSEITTALNSILDDNGVPQFLKDKMSQTSSKDIYWLSSDDVRTIGTHPAWYEELMIARCNYGEFIGLRKHFGHKTQNGEDTSAIGEKMATSYVDYLACEEKTIADELSNMPKLLINGKR